MVLPVQAGLQLPCNACQNENGLIHAESGVTLCLSWAFLLSVLMDPSAHHHLVHLSPQSICIIRDNVCHGLMVLQKEVGQFEPWLALDGGPGLGLNSLIPICSGAAEMLQPGGFLALETTGNDILPLLMTSCFGVADALSTSSFSILKEVAPFCMQLQLASGSKTGLHCCRHGQSLMTIRITKDRLSQKLLFDDSCP